MAPRLVSAAACVAAMVAALAPAAATAVEPPTEVACGPFPYLERQWWVGRASSVNGDRGWRAGLVLEYVPGLPCREVGPGAPPPPPRPPGYYAELAAGGRDTGLMAGLCYRFVDEGPWYLSGKAGGALTWQGRPGICLASELRYRAYHLRRGDLCVGARWTLLPLRGSPSARGLLFTLSFVP